jgi:hypothetical protein
LLRKSNSRITFDSSIKRNAMTTTLNTKMTIGYKFEMTTKGGVIIHAAKGRQIMVTVENDLYNVYGFNVKGVNMVKEVKINQVFVGEQLQNAIIKAALL